MEFQVKFLQSCNQTQELIVRLYCKIPKVVKSGSWGPENMQTALKPFEIIHNNTAKAGTPLVRQSPSFCTHIARVIARRACKWPAVFQLSVWTFSWWWWYICHRNISELKWFSDDFVSYVKLVHYYWYFLVNNSVKCTVWTTQWNLRNLV
jgi:hypothetical protein